MFVLSFFPPHACSAPLELSETAAPDVPGGGAGRPSIGSSTYGGEPTRTIREELVAWQTDVEPEEAKHTAWREQAEAVKEAEEASAAAWKAATGM